MLRKRYEVLVVSTNDLDGGDVIAIHKCWTKLGARALRFTLERQFATRMMLDGLEVLIFDKGKSRGEGV